MPYIFRKSFMKIGIYPGSFDPVTNGHLDIIKRAREIVDVLIVSVLDNNAKKPLFSVNNRVNMLCEVTKEFENVKVACFSGLLVDFAKKNNASFIIRGLRAVTDFEYELMMAQTNRVMSNDIDTIFLMTDLNFAYLSSSIVKEIAKYGGDVSQFVPKYVEEKLKEKINGGCYEQD